MIVMPSNGSGWFWHSLARETGKFGHLYSPGGQRGPWPWLPYALDNGAFACWDRKTNVFNYELWDQRLPGLMNLWLWALQQEQRPLWAIVPDVPGDCRATLERWQAFAPTMQDFTLALAVQDGMIPSDVRGLDPQPDVIAIGGGDDFKWGTVKQWSWNFPRVHVLRVNSPPRLYELEALGVESCDGTGWNRGDKRQTAGVEKWARAQATPTTSDLWPFTCKETKRTRKRAAT